MEHVTPVYASRLAMFTWCALWSDDQQIILAISNRYVCLEDGLIRWVVNIQLRTIENH